MLEVYSESWPAHIRERAKTNPQAADNELLAIGITLMGCGLHGITQKNLKEAQFRCAFIAHTTASQMAAAEWTQARKCLPQWLGAKGNATFKDETRAAWLRRQVQGIAREVEHQLSKETNND